MMKIIKGPDFPTGGHVIPGEGLAQAYETGKGKITIRAKMHIEVAPGDRRNIVVTEIPYGVNKADMLIKIAALKDEKKELFAGIAEIVDESDKEGLRAVIKLRKDCDVDKIIKALYKYSQLQMSYGINMVAIADGKPQLMGLLDIIAYYVSYQRDVILRRSKYELDEAKERAHIVKGLVIAVQNIDEVIQIIKNASSTSDAKSKLRVRFDLSDRQAQAILDLRLARITKLEVSKLINELQELERTIARLNVIINNKREQKCVRRADSVLVGKDEILDCHALDRVVGGNAHHHRFNGLFVRLTGDFNVLFRLAKLGAAWRLVAAFQCRKLRLDKFHLFALVVDDNVEASNSTLQFLQLVNEF